MNKTIVIFSHGLGLRKDAGWLFTDISAELETVGIQSVLFDYNEYNEDTKELFAISFSDQAKKLQNVIDATYQDNPDAKLIIIGHSQGCIIPALCDLTHISAILILSPFFHTDMKDVLERYSKLTWNILNLTGNSLRKRSDWSTTIIPAEYRKERFATDVVTLYNELAVKRELYIIYALQDAIMEFTEHNRIKNAYMINIDGDHDFKKPFRSVLIKIILHILKIQLHS
jgi:ACT domain-containing protein